MAWESEIDHVTVNTLQAVNQNLREDLMEENSKKSTLKICKCPYINVYIVYIYQR